MKLILHSKTCTDPFCYEQVNRSLGSTLAAPAAGSKHTCHPKPQFFPSHGERLVCGLRSKAQHAGLHVPFAHQAPRQSHLRAPHTCVDRAGSPCWQSSPQCWVSRSPYTAIPLQGTRRTQSHEMQFSTQIYQLIDS